MPNHDNDAGSSDNTTGSDLVGVERIEQRVEPPNKRHEAMPSSSAVSSLGLDPSIDKNGSVESSSGDGSENEEESDQLLSRSSLSDFLKGFSLSKILRPSGGYRLYITPKTQDKIGGEQHVVRAIFDNLIKDTNIKVNLHSNYISFPDKEIFDSWVRSSMLDVSSTKKKKKIVIIGSGDVAREVAFSLVENDPENNLEIAFLNRTLDRASRLTRDGLSRVSCSDDASVLKDVDMVFLSAGVRTRNIGGNSRSDSIPYNLDLIDRYGRDIVRYCPEAPVIMLTNPVEIMAELLGKVGVDRLHIYGSGLMLDSMRYGSLLVKKLLEIGIKVDEEQVTTPVIGRHEGEGMIFLRDKFTVNKRPIYNLVPRMIPKEWLDNTLDEIEKIVRIEGLTGKTIGAASCVVPARCAVQLGMSIIGMPIQRKESTTLVAAVYNKDGCFIGLPVVIQDGRAVPDESYGISPAYQKELDRVVRDLKRDGDLVTIDKESLQRSRRLNEALSSSVQSMPKRFAELSFFGNISDVKDLELNKERIKRIFYMIFPPLSIYMRNPLGDDLDRVTLDGFLKCLVACKILNNGEFVVEKKENDILNGFAIIPKGVMDRKRTDDLLMEFNRIMQSGSSSPRVEHTSRPVSYAHHVNDQVIWLDRHIGGNPDSVADTNKSSSEVVSALQTSSVPSTKPQPSGVEGVRSQDSNLTK